MNLDVIRQALEARRWINTLCLACGSTYQRCSYCGVGIKSATCCQNAQCGGHRDEPCLDGCMVTLALVESAVGVPAETRHDIERLAEELIATYGMFVSQGSVEVQHGAHPGEECSRLFVNSLRSALGAPQAQQDDFTARVAPMLAYIRRAHADWTGVQVLDFLQREIEAVPPAATPPESLGAVAPALVKTWCAEDRWEGDLSTEHPNRCKLRDNLLYADIFNDDGVTHRAVWRCHKREGHEGPCSAHNDCGVMNGFVVCGFRPGHNGPHAWETRITVAPPAAKETP